MRRAGHVLASVAVVIGLLLLASATSAQTASPRWQKIIHALEPATLPSGTRVFHDVAYGSDPRQRFDVYAPAHVERAPVILMVHGGGWRRGDKAMRGVVENKVGRWVTRGFIVISTNYRMRPDTAPLQQARDVARALAVAQRRAGEWGGDGKRFILMGHSAGAHLVALLSAEPALAQASGAQVWLGTISLDSGTLDVVQTMSSPHFPLFDQAFGDKPSDWLAASPLQQLSGRTVPFLAVCSSRRRDSCPQAEVFVRKAESLGGRGSVLREDLSHGEINQQLGLPSVYTNTVEQFMRSLDPAVARRLDGQPARMAALPVVINRSWPVR